MSTTELANTGPNPFEAYGNVAGGSTIEGDLLKFSKFGDWLVGKDAIKLEVGTRLVAQMPSLRVGWLKWIDNKPAEVLWGYVIEGHVPVRRGDLDAQDQTLWTIGTDGKKRDPWQFTNALTLVNPATDSVLTFSPSSRGGISAIGELCRKYGRRMRAHPNELPVVELGVSSYRHKIKELGEIRVPMLRIVDWVDGEEVAATVNGAHDDMMSDEIPF
jgi:hypothetical protein